MGEEEAGRGETFPSGGFFPGYGNETNVAATAYCQTRPTERQLVESSTDIALDDADPNQGDGAGEGWCVLDVGVSEASYP